MALTAKLLQLRPMCWPITDPSFTRFFSDEPNFRPNSTSTTNAEAASSPSQSKSQYSSFFSDVKSRLRQQPPPSPLRRLSPPRGPFNPSSAKPPSTIESLEEIRKNLSEFRRCSSVLPPSVSGDRKPPLSSPDGSISFLELFKRNVSPNANSNNQLPAGRYSYDAIRESLSQLKRSPSTNQANGMGKMNDSMSLSRFQESLKLKPVDQNEVKSPVVIGGSNLPLSVFGKEMKGKMEDGRGKAAMRTEFVRMYSFEELGKKLKMFRPDKKSEKKSGFSLEELNERLIKLREYEEKESELRSFGIPYKDLRESLRILQETEDDEKKSTTIQRLSVLGQIGGTPSFMLSPPKEHLVEMYFHPDNMSSAEKLKLDLKKVRDEFKMSESDCGSARVQVAQLTTKIKHLSSVLSKKDKHSRKGLIAMVQRRKKLLKYLRRTDWDSYCLVLSKLGLRDNPDLKY